MSYLTEFPDFEDETLPEIPKDWIDVSWENDACPSWRIPNHQVYVFVDRERPENRLFEAPRFGVVHDVAIDTVTLYDGNDWAEVLAIVKSVVDGG